MGWPQRLEQWRQAIDLASARSGVAAELIAAIMDRESLGGVALKPQGARGTGDFGHGRGLMQIDDRAYPDFCGEARLWQDPVENIAFGARILARNLQAFQGDVPCAVAAYNAGVHKVARLTAMMPGATIDQLDLLTTGKDYVSDVLGRLHRLQFEDSPGVA